jgi:hypothetical protein
LYDFGGVVGILAIVKRVARMCGACVCRNVLAGLSVGHVCRNALAGLHFVGISWTRPMMLGWCWHVYTKTAFKVLISKI